MQQKYRSVLTKQPIPVVSGVANHRLLKVLEAILGGVNVGIGGYPVRLYELVEGGLAPAFLVNEAEGLVQVVPEMAIAWLSNQVAKMSEKEFDRISFELALVDISFELAVSKALTKSNQQGRG